jgi:transglutaminase-like putative cysteine protease
VTARSYRVVHRTDYVYDDDVGASYGRAHLLPRDQPDQRCLSASVVVEPEPRDVHEHTDYFGNRSSYFGVFERHRQLTVTATSVVETDRTGVTWQELDDAPPTLPGIDDPANALDAAAYRLPSPMVPPLPAVAEYAAVSFPPGRPLGQALADLLGRIHSDFTYASGATTVTTTLTELLEQRRGVCQDFAHLALGCLRSVGLPARYVSGYLETIPPPGRPRLQGVDASHAWVSLLVPGLGWVDVDPTNNQPVDGRYVVVARGRDYSDVPPLKGVIFTNSKTSTLRVAVDVAPLEGTPEPAVPGNPGTVPIPLDE